MFKLHPDLWAQISSSPRFCLRPATIKIDNEGIAIDCELSKLIVDGRWNRQGIYDVSFPPPHINQVILRPQYRKRTEFFGKYRQSFGKCLQNGLRMPGKCPERWLA
jgi:hypothetical protein